jgi:hypothetical protein
VGLLVVLGFLLASSLFGAIGAWLRARRQADAEAIARRAGLEFSAEDPFDITRISFALFRKGDGNGAENVMWRTAENGRPVRAFDFWYYVEHRGHSGGTVKSYEWFTCATTLVGGNWPPLLIHREGLLDKVIDAGIGDDIDFESDEFNKTFVVRCEDRRFATALIDPRMMELLLKTKGELSFELRGRWLLVWVSKAPPALMPGLLHICDEFVERIPKVVWDLYPSPFVDDEGQLLPAGDEHRALDELLASEHDTAGDLEGADRDPWHVLGRSPFEALDDPSRPDYDLDGHVVPPHEENPWGTGRAPVHPEEAAAQEAPKGAAPSP